MPAKNPAEHPDTSLHKQKRAVLTRQEILRSARAVFARDGFEHARIEDIASGADKTRGAFYANFKDKEDVFFAIFEDDMNRQIKELGSLLLDLPTVEERVDVLSQYLSQQSAHRERALLNLEFKLYAIRHPRKRKRLANLYTNMKLGSSIPEFNRLLLEVIGENAGTQLNDSLAICGIMDGLALNHLFDPDTLDDQDLARYTRVCLREALQSLLKA